MTDPGVTPVRIGLAGYGRGGRYFHAPLIGLAPECALAAVVTRNPARRAELAQDFPGVQAVDGLGDLAAAGAEAVVVTTPLDTHEALVREAIGLGLPVVCDKPFTPDAASWAKMATGNWTTLQVTSAAMDGDHLAAGSSPIGGELIKFCIGAWQ